MKNRWRLIWPVWVFALLPLAAAWFAYPSSHLPPGFGVFPPQFVRHPPAFDAGIFGLLAVIEVITIAFIVFPRGFGFKQVAPGPSPTMTRLPAWFWAGAATMLFFWWLMWSGTRAFGDLVYYAFTPLWWGLILTLDGLVYGLSGGRSLLASRPKTLLASAVFSVVGWYAFEYLDYFMLSSWYYPNDNLPALSHAKTVAVFLVAYSTVWPSIFEWYALLSLFPRLTARYANGPRLRIPAAALIGGGAALLIGMVFWPNQLFWAAWLGPFVIAGVLMRHGIWTPFTAMQQGDWRPFVLIALASLCDGFFWELWNYGSTHFHAQATNPNYWIYVIPYVNRGHLFSEMPLLGYAGYLPFGVVVWVTFIWAGEVLGFDHEIAISPGASRDEGQEGADRYTPSRPVRS